MSLPGISKAKSVNMGLKGQFYLNIDVGALDVNEALKVN